MSEQVSVEAFAPAKINLALHVVGRRADGYHLLDSLVAFADFGDRIEIHPAAQDGFSVSGPFAADVPRDNQNLVLQARDMLRDATGTSAFPVHIHLDKRLPVASGIGGGSSDAAAALRALCEIWSATAAPQQLDAIALRLGADVPMCLYAQAAHIGGIGEEISPVCGLPPLPAVLVNPGASVATPAVFARLEQRFNPPLPPFPDQGTAWLDWLRSMRNDLQAPAIAAAPAIADALRAIRETGAEFQRMSGSGATCFGLFSSAVAAKQAAEMLVEQQPGWFVQPTLLA